jgi:acyl-CoA hydrolase
MTSHSRASGIAALLTRFRPGMKVFLHAGPSESLALRQALKANPERAAGVTFSGTFLPGVNSFDYAGLTETSRSAGPFVPPSARSSFADGRHDHLPLHYSAMPEYFAGQAFDLAVLHLPPDQNGVFSWGLNAEAVSAGLHAREIAVILNPELPYTRGAAVPGVSRASWLIDGDAPLLRIPADSPDDVSRAIGRHIASEIRDGDTIQTGLGRIPGAILSALSEHRGLRMHTGMITDAAAGLTEAGAIDLSAQGGPSPPILTGMAAGTEIVYCLAGCRGVEFHGADVTHDLHRIAAIGDFVAINSAIEVDLLGQVNGEIVQGRQISGIGGSGDFARAARLSARGRSIIALPSTVKEKSRIVPLLGPGAVTQPRADADIVATEHGLARLRHLSVDRRAEALIAIADPLHRSDLAAAWYKIRAQL